MDVFPGCTVNVLIGCTVDVFVGCTVTKLAGCCVDVLVSSSVGGGVQVGGRMLRGVDVWVGIATGEGRAGGLNGLRDILGLMKTVRKVATTQITPTSMIIVSTFQTKFVTW
jgi:hypothetical protein